MATGTASSLARPYRRMLLGLGLAYCATVGLTISCVGKSWVDGWKDHLPVLDALLTVLAVVTSAFAFLALAVTVHQQAAMLQLQSDELRDQNASLNASMKAHRDTVDALRRQSRITKEQLVTLLRQSQPRFRQVGETSKVPPEKPTMLRFVLESETSGPYSRMRVVPRCVPPESDGLIYGRRKNSADQRTTVQIPLEHFRNGEIELECVWLGGDGNTWRQPVLITGFGRMDFGPVLIEDEDLGV